MLQFGDVAERWLDRGELDKAKALFAEGRSIANQIDDKKDRNRALFAARLARVDLPAALQIAKDFAGDRDESHVLGNIAFHIAVDNPADAERLWIQTKRMSRRSIDAEICWKLAGVDPAGARRTLEGMPWIDQKPDFFVSLALGAKARDPSASQRALETGLQGLDRIMRERPERYQMFVGTLLPAVERIDPALVPEMLWRDVASRPPIVDPRVGHGYSPTRLVAQLAWYDRQVAAAGFRADPNSRGWNRPIPTSWPGGVTSFWRGRSSTPAPRSRGSNRHRSATEFTQMWRSTAAFYRGRIARPISITAAAGQPVLARGGDHVRWHEARSLEAARKQLSHLS